MSALPESFPPVRFSRLSAMAKSPAHYKAIMDLGRPDTAAMRLGRLVHVLVLGDPAAFSVWEGVRRGKAWDEFAAAHPDQEIVSGSEMEAAANIAEAIVADEAGRELLTGEREREIRWQFAGRDCAGRPDVFNKARVVDLKTTTDAHPERFARTALRLGYHAQLAWYQDGLTAAGICAPEEAYIVAVETKPPYVVTRFKLTDRALDFGRRCYALWWEQLMVCERSGLWPGYSEATVPLDSPEDLNLVIDGEEIAT